eukprot:6203666-Amphidinium_carterae.1
MANRQTRHQSNVRLMHSGTYSAVAGGGYSHASSQPKVVQSSFCMGGPCTAVSRRTIFERCKSVSAKSARTFVA